MSNKFMVLGIVVIVLGVVAFSALFTVQQTEQALVLQFGEPKRVIRKPGLKIKLPFVQDVTFYDRRVLDLDPPAEEIILSDQRRLVVDSFARYRIVDALKFYQSVRSEFQLRDRLGDIVRSSIRRVLGGVTLLSVLSRERSQVMENIRTAVTKEAGQFGIQIVDVRIRRAELPEQAAQAIYARMRSERGREAREARAEGFEKSQEIRAGADRERTVLLAEAQKESEILRGQGERQAYGIYADAFAKDPEFFRFTRSMQAYRKAFQDNDTTMVLSPDSEFFRYFGILKGSAPKPGR